MSGYFDPLHAGHVDYLRNSKAMADRLVVILNRDDQSKRGVRTRQESRRKIMESIRWVDSVVLATDDGPSVAETLRNLHPDVFAKGMHASPSELDVCAECGIEVVTNVGSEIHLEDIEFSYG